MFHPVMWHLPYTICNLETTAVHNLESVPVKMEACEDMQFKQCAVTVFLTVNKIPAIDIHHHMQAVYGIKVLM